MLRFCMQAASKYINIYFSQNISTWAIPTFRTPGHPHLPKPTKSVWELPLLAPQLHSRQKSRLEGGRNQVTLLYEFEDKSRVVHDRVCRYTYSFTLQGLYIYTHSPRGQLGISWLTLSHRSAVKKTSGYGHHPAFPDLGCVLLRGVGSGLWSLLHLDPTESCYSGPLGRTLSPYTNTLSSYRYGNACS